MPKEIDLAVPLAPWSDLVALLDEDVDWTYPYIAYLENKTLPTDETEARMITRRAKSFVIINGELHKRSITGVFQCCVTLEEGRNILLDIHSGDCGHHASFRSLVIKALSHGFYYPTAHTNAVDIIQRCIVCQKYATQTHLPGSILKTIPITWTFTV